MNDEIRQTIQQALVSMRERITDAKKGWYTSGNDHWLPRIDAALAAMQQPQGWQPVEYLVNSSQLELHADNIGVTIGMNKTALATFMWPEEGSYAVCQLVSQPQQEES